MWTEEEAPLTSPLPEPSDGVVYMFQKRKIALEVHSVKSKVPLIQKQNKYISFDRKMRWRRTYMERSIRKTLKTHTQVLMILYLCFYIISAMTGTEIITVIFIIVE
jgi:hypothetical protein